MTADVSTIPSPLLSATSHAGAGAGRARWPQPRPGATLGVADVTEWFGETSGGIRTYLLEKGRYVAARPWLRQALVVPGPEDTVESELGVTRYRLRGPRIPRQHPYRFMLATRTLRDIIAHERPQVIEVGSPFLTPWLMRRVGRALDIPVIAFYHTNLPRLVDDPRGAMSRASARLIHDALLRYVRLLHAPLPLTIASSRYAIEDLERAGVERIARVPLGVDLDRFVPRTPSERMAIRQARGLPTDRPVVAFVGRFAREKALDVLLDAWPTVAARTDAELVLVGDGPLAARLRAHPAAPRFLSFERDRQRLAELMASVDLLVSPGPVETFGLAALEALASGTPVLTVDRGGVPEFVAASGAGASYPLGDAAALADHAITLLRGDPAALGARGRAYVEQRHSWTTVFDQLFALYAQLLRDG